MSPPARLCVSIAAVVVASYASACGSGDGEPAPVRPERLTAAERRALDTGHAAIRSYCRRLGLHLSGRVAAPDAAARARALRGARGIAALARLKPGAPYASGRTVRELVGDTAEDLEGTNCSAALVAELARGL